MFKRKQKELLASDASDSIAPWEMLSDADITTQTARMRARWPERNLIAVARRLDKDAVACFDKGTDGTAKAVVVVEDLDAADGPAERHYKGFGDWFDAALADAQRE